VCLYGWLLEGRGDCVVMFGGGGFWLWGGEVWFCKWRLLVVREFCVFGGGCVWGVGGAGVLFLGLGGAVLFYFSLFMGFSARLTCLGFVFDSPWVFCSWWSGFWEGGVFFGLGGGVWCSGGGLGGFFGGWCWGFWGVLFFSFFWLFLGGAGGVFFFL